MAGYSDCRFGMRFKLNLGYLNFCFVNFRNHILQSRQGINDVLQYLKIEEPMAHDSAMQKYLSRLKSKLKKQSAVDK